VEGAELDPARLLALDDPLGIELPDELLEVLH
jgi:hypothetical protein